MAKEVTYLELSEDAGTAHKFYEVTVDGNDVAVRYGRIGDAGQTQAQRFASEAEARAFAKKKLGEKTRKGYAPAVQGGRARRAVASRVATARPSTTRRTAPLVWSFGSASSGHAVGLHVDRDLCWLGNQRGGVYALDHAGQVKLSFQLPDDVQSIVADQFWRYAGCSDGFVYDLSAKVPRKAYEIAKDTHLHWLDIVQGTLIVSDGLSCVTVFHPEGDERWKRRSAGDRGWMVRADPEGIYHGHSQGVTAYDWDGNVRWRQPTGGWCTFGWQDETRVYASCSDGKVYAFTKDGAAGTVFACDSFIASCAASPGGEYVFAGDDTTAIYCFDAKGTRRWKLASGCGVAGSMQYFEDKLFLATWSAHLGCVDLSAAAIEAATRGEVSTPRAVAAPTGVAAAPSDALETVKSAAGGVVLECFREGGRLRVRVVSDGYQRAWHCQFPRDLREEGARYVVDAVHEVSGGGYYRAHGEIKRLA